MDPTYPLTEIQPDDIEHQPAWGRSVNAADRYLGTLALFGCLMDE